MESLPTMEDITAGGWTVVVAVNFVRQGFLGSPASFRCGFVSRNEQGDLVVADGAEFRRQLNSGQLYDRALAHDAGEERYGQNFVDLLVSDGPKIIGLPVSVYDSGEMVKLLDAVKRHGEAVNGSFERAKRDMVTARDKARAKPRVVVQW